MIRKVRIRNFKSIKDLEFKPKKINIFIGEPNTGKSNILEAIGLFSFPYAKLTDVVRSNDLSDLFFDDNVEEDVIIDVDDKHITIHYDTNSLNYVLTAYSEDLGDLFGCSQQISRDGVDSSRNWSDKAMKVNIKLYRFKTLTEYPERKQIGFLKPIYGENLPSLLRTHKSLRDLVKSMFDAFGYRLMLKPETNNIEIVKVKEDMILSLPYTVVSDTLRRHLFHMLAIKSNKDSVLLFEEPEAHAFPRHIKTLAETIAMDKTNQFFIATHNPYLLRSIMEKAPKGSLNIYATYMEDYQTRLKLLDRKTMEDIFVKDLDPFFNLERFLEG
ncbi:MAG: hypothetical protein DRN40_01340 [Thermoplasmata archaeon]|nr:MAG: hypothetical protein DRN40_01340 [Thermoplasmata archaeon]